MLKVLRDSRLHGPLHNFSVKFPSPGGQSRVLLHRFFDYFGNSNVRRTSFSKRAPFCSESGDGSKPPLVEAGAESESVESETATENVAEGDLRSSSAIVSTNPKPEDYLQVAFLLLYITRYYFT